MNPKIWISLAGCLLTSSLAEAQFTTAGSTTKQPGLTTPTTTGTFQGADDCAAPHTSAGAGSVSGVPFTTGTTGTTGQNEANCYSFGTSGIDGDVWYDWTASATGDVTLTTCSGSSVDTKLAAWPDNSPASCPADGTSLACNDDACGLQSTVQWSGTAGTTYTLQVGTFPGAAGGSGTFDVTETVPPPCGALDDGVSENSLGLVAGGEMGWLNGFDCLGNFDAVLTAYGSALFPDPTLDGNDARVAVYTDSDTDPSNGAVKIDEVATVVVNAGTDLLNLVPLTQTWTLDPTAPSNVRTFLLASADHAPGQFPGPMDESNPSPDAWIVGSTLGPGTLDTDDLTNNNVPPMNMASIGFPAVWMLRAVDTTTGVNTGTPLCFGDGSGAPCGCNNEDTLNPGTGGCLNGLGVGAVLSSSGLADVTNDSLTLNASGVPAQPALFCQGQNVLGMGGGTTFGDGLRCCGGSMLRLEIVTGSPPEPTSISTSITISTHPGQSGLPGTSKCYQLWYRDPNGSPCGSNFNFSNALSVLWV